MDILSKTGRGESKEKINCRESRKHGSIPFRRHLSVLTLILPSRLGSLNWTSNGYSFPASGIREGITLFLRTLLFNSRRQLRGGCSSSALERLRTLYSRPYARGVTSTANVVSPEAMKRPNKGRKLGRRTHPGAAGSNLFLATGEPYPIRAPDN